MLPIADGFRQLGVQYFPLLDPGAYTDAISGIVYGILNRIAAAHVGGGETRFLAEQVTWTKVGYRHYVWAVRPGGLRSAAGRDAFADSSPGGDAHNDEQGRRCNFG